MSNYAPSTRARLADIIAGIRVDRATQGMDDEAIFTVAGGNVLVLSIVGEVTTALENTANNTKLTSTPTTGTAVDLCANLDTANFEIGAFLTITGTLSDALVKTNAGAAKWQAVPVVVAPGTIDINVAAPQDGSVKWSIWYVPLEAGAYIETA